jgi:HSP20 family protein
MSDSLMLSGVLMNTLENMFRPLDITLGFPRSFYSETDTEYVITTPLPGAKRDNLGVYYENGAVHVRYSGEEERTELRGWLQQHWTGKMHRRFEVPEDVVEKNIKASYVDGVLTVIMPRIVKEVPAESRIDIEIS